MSLVRINMLSYATKSLIFRKSVLHQHRLKKKTRCLVDVTFDVDHDYENALECILDFDEDCSSVLNVNVAGIEANSEGGDDDA